LDIADVTTPSARCAKLKKRKEREKKRGRRKKKVILSLNPPMWEADGGNAKGEKRRNPIS